VITFWYTVPPAGPHPNDTSSEGAALMRGCELIVRKPWWLIVASAFRSPPADDSCSIHVCHMRRRINVCHMRRRIHVCQMKRRVHLCHVRRRPPAPCHRTTAVLYSEKRHSIGT
jgi:hypothetical protein